MDTRRGSSESRRDSQDRRTDGADHDSGERRNFCFGEAAGEAGGKGVEAKRRYQ